MVIRILLYTFYQKKTTIRRKLPGKAFVLAVGLKLKLLYFNKKHDE